MSDDMSMGLPSSAGEHGVLRSMQEVAMSSQEASKMLRTYNIAWWGNNYYDVNELGHISVCPDPDVPEARVDLAKLVKAREAQGYGRASNIIDYRYVNYDIDEVTKDLLAVTDELSDAQLALDLINHSATFEVEL